MDQHRMIFNIDRSSITEGDVVKIMWQCESAERVMLTLDNGYRSSEIALGTSGSKFFRLHRSKGRTRLTLTVTIQGKAYSKTLRVRVKKMPTTRAETVDSRGRRIGKLTQWWQSILPKWHTGHSQLRQGLQSLPERKQVAIKLLILLGVILILSAIWPKIYGIGFLLIIIYLAVILFKR